MLISRSVRLVAVFCLIVLVAIEGCGRAPEGPPGPATIEESSVDGPGTLGRVIEDRPVRGVVVYFHGMDELADVTKKGPARDAFSLALLRAGYAVVSADAGGNAFGNPASREAYRNLARAAQEKYQAPVEFFVAESMGALPALALLSEPEGRQVKGLVGISPLTGIPPAGRQITFIVSAWGGTVPPAADPLSWPPGAFAGKQFELYYSDTDQVIPAVASAPAFQERFGAVAGVRVHECSGGHVAADCFRGDDVVAWMQSRL